MFPAQQNNLNQNENDMEQNSCFTHFNSPDTGHGVWNSADSQEQEKVTDAIYITYRSVSSEKGKVMI